MGKRKDLTPFAWRAIERAPANIPPDAVHARGAILTPFRGARIFSLPW